MDGLLVTLVMAAISGQTGIVEVHITPAPADLDDHGWVRLALRGYARLKHAELPDRALTVVGMRGLPIGTMAAEHWETQRQADEMSAAHPGASVVVGRPGQWSFDASSLVGDGLKAATAARYVELVQSGHGSPLQQLADEFGIGVAGVRRRLSDARDAGFLTEARKGVAGGELTEAGKANLPLRIVRGRGSDGERTEAKQRGVARQIPRA